MVMKAMGTVVSAVNGGFVDVVVTAVVVVRAADLSRPCNETEAAKNMCSCVCTRTQIARRSRSNRQSRQTNDYKQY